MIVGSNILAGASGQAGYFLQRSVRLRSSASAYFTRTPASAGNRKTWTWSAWVKRGLLSSSTSVFGAYTSVNAYAGIYFDSSTNTLGYQDRASGVNNAFLVTTQVFRDPSAWYHIILAIDTTQATASNRLKMYINGVEVTAFSTATYPSLNYDGFVNNNILHELGSLTGGNYFDGYLTEINFINGQALTPTSFGEYNVLTGVWQPKKYGGTYGTNGFYLNFNDNSAATAAAIGKDSSGNGNNWTPNNISVTAGVTYDSMTDVPTLTSATTANYATLNPLANAALPTLTNGNLFLTTPTTQTGNAFSSIEVSSGKWYLEIIAGSVSGGLAIGICNSITQTTFIGNTANSWSYFSTGQKYNNGTATAYGASYTTNDVIGIALDMDAGTITFYKNNTSQGQAFSGLTGSLFFAVGDGSSSLSCSAYANFGQQPFTYTPPTGFVAINTYNLPAPTIPNGATQFAATLWTGDGADPRAINNSGSMQPDLVWIKARGSSTLSDNVLDDSVRGATKDLFSNLTAAEGANNSVRSFNTNGFSVGNSTRVNQNSIAYVGWQWKASNAAAVTNTSGTISSQVSANPSAGFSIVTYTGTGANATVGHGLGIAPKMIIVKQRSAAGQNWAVYHSSLANTGGLALNLTNSTITASGWWNNTSPTSSVFSLGGSTGVDWFTTNQSTATYVAYCFSEIAGYSKFGSYTGNGSTDGPFVYLGFRPRFVLIKNSSVVSDWIVFDSARNTYNVTNSILQPNTSGAEFTGAAYNIDFTSNGFKLRNTTNANINGSGNTHIYAAFAESPFNYSLAR